MENIDQNRRNLPDENEGRNQNENVQPLSDNDNPPQDDALDGLVDLDGDGMIGNTGGFYGGTSYIGSNYGADWNSEDSNDNRGKGNFGAAGQADLTDDDNDRREEGDRGRISKDDSVI